MELEDIKLCEISQAQRDKMPCVFTYRWKLKKVDLIEIQSRIVVTRHLKGKEEI
jgi:hypothetical protein